MLQSFFWIHVNYFIYESVWIAVGASVAPSSAVVMCHLPLRKQRDGVHTGVRKQLLSVLTRTSTYLYFVVRAHLKCT